jgi:hypothetical protein
VKIGTRWLVLALSGFGAGAGCGGDLPSCPEGSGGRLGRPAVLTGAPQFTSSQIKPGDSIAIAVPVNENTMAVGVGIRVEDHPEPGSPPRISLFAKTNGGEVVQLPVYNADIAPGVYYANISLHGESSPEDNSDYTSSQGGVPYILSWWYHFEQPQRRCRTDILAPTFEVVSDSPSRSQ